MWGGDEKNRKTQQENRTYIDYFIVLSVVRSEFSFSLLYCSRAPIRYLFSSSGCLLCLAPWWGCARKTSFQQIQYWQDYCAVPSVVSYCNLWGRYNGIRGVGKGELLNSLFSSLFYEHWRAKTKIEQPIGDSAFKITPLSGFLIYCLAFPLLFLFFSSQVVLLLLL